MKPFDRFNKDNRAQISAVDALRMVGLLVVLMLVYFGIVDLSNRINNAADIPSDSAWNAHGIDTSADLLESPLLWLVLAILFVVLLFGKSIVGGR
jgi:ABC-type amino acid transport system permease subunit